MNNKTAEQAEQVLQECWNSRRPFHEQNLSTGKDMFWGTLVMVIQDFNRRMEAYASQPAATPVAPTLPEGEDWKEAFDYPAAARAIALWLKDFCNEELPYPEMIADAARRVRQDRDNWVEMWRTACEQMSFYKRFMVKERKVTLRSHEQEQTITTLRREVEELKAENQKQSDDIVFLSKRSQGAARITFGDNERDTGMSSNSIVSIAYGLLDLEDQYLPGDADDMRSCERMWKKLPEHRKTENAVKAIEVARKSNYYGKSRL